MDFIKKISVNAPLAAIYGIGLGQLARWTIATGISPLQAGLYSAINAIVHTAIEKFLKTTFFTGNCPIPKKEQEIVEKVFRWFASSFIMWDVTSFAYCSGNIFILYTSPLIIPLTYTICAIASMTLNYLTHSYILIPTYQHYSSPSENPS